ncbi:DoxX family protein [Saccharopolyspora sp. NPDC000359]|uniref:DoxX family protein n=1 Tax=Saccharopolyspora sp. NPDC000359 TaxID=3154251 RepID=UPI00331D841E
MRILFAVFSAVTSLVFFGVGVMKLVNTPLFVAQLGLPSPVVVLLGLLELAGAAGLLIGLRVRLLGAAAAIGSSLLMVGAVGFHVMNGDLVPSGALPVVLLVFAVVVAVQHVRALRPARATAPSSLD